MPIEFESHTVEVYSIHHTTTNKTDHRDITEILLTVALNTIALTPTLLQ